MMHLTIDQLYGIAEAAEEMRSYSDDELAQMEHLKNCRECYESFCVLSMLLEASSEAAILGYGYQAEAVKDSKAEQQSKAGKRILAVINVTLGRIQDAASTVIKQIQPEHAVFQFSPVPMAAARGYENVESSILKLEEIEDEKTFIVFDTAKRELMVQLNAKNLAAKTIRIYLDYENGNVVELPLSNKGSIYKSILADIPDGNFRIYIEND